jgi:tRNA (guanine37-N1)-methyltransferase
LRAYARDKHRTVDDRPFGGGEGMVMKPEPIFEAVESLLGIPAQRAGHPSPAAAAAVVLLSAAGKLFRQTDARRLAQMERVILICGRYEGVDERVAEHLATDEYSIGDFVLSGGELPAAMIVDAVTRLRPGALGNEDSAVQESFSVERGKRTVESEPATASGLSSTKYESPLTDCGILDWPLYTRPENFRGWTVPEVLLSGNHEQIRRWRAEAARAKTRRNRPDLLAGATLCARENP